MADESKNTKQHAQELDDNQMDKVAGGDGTTEHFFTVEIGEGRVASQSDPSLTTETEGESAIASIRRVSPDTIDPAS